MKNMNTTKWEITDRMNFIKTIIQYTPMQLLSRN